MEYGKPQKVVVCIHMRHSASYLRMLSEHLKLNYGYFKSV